MKKDSKFSGNSRQNQNNKVISFSGKKTEFKKSNDDASPRCFKCRLKGHSNDFVLK